LKNQNPTGFIDEKAFKKLFLKHYQPLLGYCITLINNHETSHEIVQEAFLQLWERWERVDGEFNVKAYLFRCVHNQAFNHLRHLKIVKSEKAQQELKPGTDRQNEDFLLIQSAIDKALIQMPQRQRLIFELSRMDGYKHEEIARQLNISYKTVEAQVRNARHFLQKKLKGYYNELF
jgi:RNA polymerase sigma-70 factor (ECF subfamily)